jgi:hypothetical protein
MAKRKSGKKRQKKAVPVNQQEQFSIPKKRVKGEGVFYDERKKQISMSLTPTALTRLDIIAEEAGLSRSEFLERVLRRLIEFPPRFTRLN